MKKFGLEKGKKEDYFVLGLGIALVTVVFLIVIIIANQDETSQQPTIVVTPPVLPTSTPASSPFTFSNQENQITFDEETEQKLFNKLLNRELLSNNDTSAKNTILSLLPQGQQSGTVYQTDAFRVEYSASGDLFYVEILTQNISEAKGDANLWFRNQGMSQQGLCNAPVIFYLNWEVVEQLPDKNIEFDSLAPNC